MKGKSDPYVKLKLAGRSFRSRVIREDLNPHWNEVFEVIVTSIPGQELEAEVFDKDLDKDDFLGRCKVSLTTVLNSGFLDEWLTLEDVPSGRLHLRLERLTPRPTAAELEEVLQVNSLIQTQKSAELAAALLSVYLSGLRTCRFEKVPSLPALMLLLLWEKLLIKLRLFPKHQPPSGMRVPPFSSGNQTSRAWSCRFGARGLVCWARCPCPSPSSLWLTGSA